MGEAKRKMIAQNMASYLEGSVSMGQSLRAAFQVFETKIPGGAISITEVIRVIDDAILMVNKQREGPLQ